MNGIETTPPLADFRRQLKAAGKEFQKELQKANKTIATLMRGKVQDSYNATHRSKRAVNQIRPRAAQTWAGIAMGGAKAPFMMGQNFGANPNSRDSLGRRMTRFPERAEPDYHIYAQLGKNKDEILNEHTKAVEEVMRRAFSDGGR